MNKMPRGFSSLLIVSVPSGACEPASPVVAPVPALTSMVLPTVAPAPTQIVTLVPSPVPTMAPQSVETSTSVAAEL